MTDNDACERRERGTHASTSEYIHGHHDIREIFCGEGHNAEQGDDIVRLYCADEVGDAHEQGPEVKIWVDRKIKALVQDVKDIFR